MRPTKFLAVAVLSLACVAPATAAQEELALDMIEYETSSECLAALSDMPSLCANVRFSGFETVQAARWDVDGDGHKDLVVRRFTRSDCASYGCTTRVFLSREGALRPTQPVVTAAGLIVQCDIHGRRGLNLAHVENGPCISFK